MDEEEGDRRGVPARMGSLPDEIWAKILRMGVEAGTLDYRDLCSLSFVSRRLGHLSSLDCVWHAAWFKDFGSLADLPQLLPKPKRRMENDTLLYRNLYKTRFEKVRAVKMAAHRRRVLRVESQMAVMRKEAESFQTQLQLERKRLSSALVQLKNFEYARHAAVAVQVWQPHAVRAKQQEVLEQQPVNAAAQQRSLEMEVVVCREQIQQFERSLLAKRRALEKSMQDLQALTFDPSREFSNSVNEIRRSSTKPEVKRKREGSSSSSR